MVNQNKIISFKIKRQVKDVFLSDVERTVAIIRRNSCSPLHLELLRFDCTLIHGDHKVGNNHVQQLHLFILDKGLRKWFIFYRTLKKPRV